MRDVMATLRTIALADADVAALVTDDFIFTDDDGNEVNENARVYVNRIPRRVIEAADHYHPPQMLVLRMTPASRLKADELPVVEQVIDAICYGETDFEADALRRAVYQLFTTTQRYIDGDLIVHHVNPTGSPQPNTEKDLVWPIVSQGFAVSANLLEVA